jgi:hypothetical protein
MFLKEYAALKCELIVNTSQISNTIAIACINVITKYIYEKYRFQYVIMNEYVENTTNIIDDNSSFEDDIITILSGTQNTRREEPTPETLTATLINDYEILFSTLLYNDVGLIENILEEKYTDEKIDCNICYDKYYKQDCVTFGCNHEFCKDCTKKIIKEKPSCPYCREPVTKLISRTHDVYKELEKIII